ncbi:MAG: type II CRISPR RNA-guided endonuclease Cas9 [Butyrivibrio sp.]
MQNENYYAGLDIGTNSVGYAVTDQDYNLLRHGGEPMWGSHIFEEGATAQERRSFRTARRRNDRKKQRIALVSEIFAPEIAKVDSRFFIRRKESALFREDVEDGDRFIVFNDEDFNDRDFYEKYPTIHHLIKELMENHEKHDIRLVYIACAYLVAHRGHFLSEVSKDNIAEVLDFDNVYNKYMSAMRDYDDVPWDCDTEEFKKILSKKQTVSNKERDFLALLNGGKKFKASDDDVISKEGIVKLLSGGTYELGKLFPQIEFEDKVSVSFKMSEEDFMAVLAMLDDEAEVLSSLRNVYDWATLSGALKGGVNISDGKVAIYEQHKKDLEYLKKFVRKYIPDKYYEIFRDGTVTSNYVSYSYNIKNSDNTEKIKKAKKEDFCDYIKKIVKDVQVEENDKTAYDDMMLRLETYSFMPKQVESDNRVIPYQLYYHELKVILENAKIYLPFLSDADSDGYTNEAKILSIMEFRIPYYVGPLRTDNGEHGWMKRKSEGKIYPWNFEEKVDLDASEQEFINRMTNTCSYLPGEGVLPKYSLLYCKFNVLNEINNIKINGKEIPVEHKQGIYNLFKNYRKVTVKKVKDYLMSNNLLHGDDVMSGLDITIKSSLKSYHDFKRLLESGSLTEEQVEDIINHLTYSEDKRRIVKWLNEAYPVLSDEDVKYISKLQYNDFGRLSARFLSGIKGCNKETGESGTIIGMLWNTNDNMMQLLSDKYTFTDEIENIRNDYYSEHPASVDSLLDSMYISNAVKRPIYRTLSILSDVRKACKCDPQKIFVEMARGNGEKGKRTKSRRDQINELYKNMDTAEVRELSKQLEGKSDNELQSEVLFLYFMQLGKCAYTGSTIDIDKLKTSTYNVDHIYPQCYVKDDSLNNKVLVLSEKNGEKGDTYPISESVRSKMQPFWHMLRQNNLISEEKYKRLVRNTPFTTDERQGFINRQLVETQQSTKAVATVLQTLFPHSEIIYSKAGLVSDFRHEFDMIKCRSVNDLHHAKDAYLNVVVGNVYHCRFTKRFYIDQQYSLKTKTIFTHQVKDGNNIVWHGEDDIARIRKVMNKNNIHYTKFAFMRKGGLFHQMPIKASSSLIPRKDGLDTEKYGGYSNSTATAFLLVKYKDKGKNEAMIMPVDLMSVSIALSDETSAVNYAKATLEKIWGRSEGQITEITFPIGIRALKVNTMLSFDGFRACVTCKANGGQKIGLSSMMPLVIGYEWDIYIKKLDDYITKKEKNKNIILNENYDGISKKKNCELYDILSSKVIDGIYSIPFSSQAKVLKEGCERFEKLTLEKQVKALTMMVLLLKSGRAGSCDLKLIDGSPNAGKYSISSKLSNCKGKYGEVYIIDISASGIYETKSMNLMELVD